MDKFLDYNGDVILFHMNNICKSKERCVKCCAYKMDYVELQW